MVKILSWNILHGGGARGNQILDAIVQEKPDIVTLQEFRHNSNKEMLLQGLRDIQLSLQFVPAVNSARVNTLIIASRYEFNANIFPTHISSTARTIHAQFPALKSLNFFAAHLPHKKQLLPYFHALLDLPNANLSGNSLIIGDLNCGIPFEDSETKSFYATHLFQQLLRDGWIDAWRNRNKNKREFTWISTKMQNGFRYDHALVSPSFNRLINELRYDHSVRVQGLSDH